MAQPSPAMSHGDGRRGEILRLQPAHVKLDANLIRIAGEVSKVREPRNVTIQPNLAAWLQAYPARGGRCVDRACSAATGPRMELRTFAVL
jgi:integrase